MKRATEKSIPVALRLPVSTHTAIVSRCKAERISVSELMRNLVYAEFDFSNEPKESTEAIKNLERKLVELGKDFQVFARLLMVALEVSSDEEARAWCAKNLKVG